MTSFTRSLHNIDSGSVDQTSKEAKAICSKRVSRVPVDPGHVCVPACGGPHALLPAVPGADGHAAVQQALPQHHEGLPGLPLRAQLSVERLHR